jgi:hypothetical protein
VGIRAELLPSFSSAMLSPLMAVKNDQIRREGGAGVGTELHDLRNARRIDALALASRDQQVAVSMRLCADNGERREFVWKMAFA